ncbi:uncharacterized protein LOC126457138 [Schistocerca serialis cubense]|uniref:uncharacterized protein LOC126457138 n=1 Tax=Schistocerca serialis cubense TaxID=2023355 RepID=UPI00214E7807|nr:uncharacterized protein LOC126457138 [Schistocerca serialis cubense]
MEAEKAELKSILRGLLISSPKQMTVRELANDFSRQEGREFPFQKYGFRTFVDYLRTIKDTVLLSGFQPIYVTPVVKESTAHVNELVLKQKNSTSKKSSYKSLEKSQRKRGWVPIVIPPDPAKTLPTLLDIKIPSRNKFMLNVPATRKSTRNSTLHGFPKSEVVSGNKNINGGKNYAKVVYEKVTESQESNLPHIYERKQADACNVLENKMKTVASKPSEKWEDICEENKGHDDSLFQKYCVQNIKFRSINNIDEWFPKDIPEISPQNSVIVSHGFKDDGNNFEHSENVINNITKSSAMEFSERKTDSSLLYEQDTKTCVKGTSTPSSPVSSSGSSFNESSLHNRLFSEKTVSNMKKLIKDNPQGLWASEFPAIYKEHFGVALDYHAYGYVSMAAVAAAYSDVFICLRRSSADFLLFDSEAPLPKHYANSGNMNSFGVVTEVIKSNVERLIAEFPTGLPVGKFKEMYKLYFSEDLNEEELGFSSLNAMLQTLHEEFILRVRQVGKNTLLYPARNLDSIQQEPPLCTSVMEYDSVELYTAYPPEVLDPHDTIQKQPLPRLRGDFPVLVSDVTSPSHFCMILYDIRPQLESLMDEIQFFYTTEGEKYKMPHSAICKGLLCIARYESNQEWHRVQICSVKDGMSKIKINYIDYGTVGYVRSEELRFMHRDFAQLPMQGIPSRLANVEPAVGEWKKEVSNYFLDLVRGKILMAVIDRTNQDNLTSVGLVDTSGEDDVHINDQLVLTGHAKFKYDPPQKSTDVSIGKSELELSNNDFEMNTWKSDGTTFHAEEFTNGVDSCLVPSTVTASACNKGKGPLPFSGSKKDDKLQNSPAVSIELGFPNNFETNHWKSEGKTSYGQKFTNGDDCSSVSSTVTIPTYDKWKGPVSFFGADVKERNIEPEKKSQPGTTTLTDGSANKWYEKAFCTSSSGTKVSEIGHSPSKEDISKVWGAPLIIPTSICSSPSTSSEGDTSLNLKKIPNTWKDVKYSTLFDSDHLKRNTGSVQLGSKMQNASTCDAKELPSRNSVSPRSGNAQTGSSHTTFVPDNSQNESPHAATAPRNNSKDTSFAHHGLYAHNMWNLGNISVSPPWIASGNRPVVSGVSALVQAGQASWFHPAQNTQQFPLTPIVGVTPIPPPGFTPIQNPFVAFTTSRLPAVVDPRLSILDGAFVYQHQNNPWIPRFSEAKSAPNHRSFPNSAGPFSTGLNNSGKFASPTPDICEITQSTEDLLNIEDCSTGIIDAEQELESNKITVINQEVKPCGISQCTQTTLDGEVLEDNLKHHAQRSERITSETVREVVDGSRIGDNKEANMASDYNRKFENEHKSPDVFVFSANSLEAAQSAENCTITEQDSEPTVKIDFETLLSRSLKKLEIDSSLGSTVPSKSTVTSTWTTQNSVENDKLHSCSAETSSKDEDITRYVPAQEVDLTTEEKGRQPVRYIKKTLISGRVLNLINYNEQAYFCTDEFVRSFSKFSGRHVLLKILDTTGMTLPFVEVNRTDNFEMFQMLDNCDLNTKSRKPNGQIHDVLHLVPLRSATDLLKALKISDVSIFSGLMEEVENFNPEDDYWYRD